MVSYLEDGAFSRHAWDSIGVSALFSRPYSYGAYINIDDMNAWLVAGSEGFLPRGRGLLQANVEWAYTSQLLASLSCSNQIS